MRSESSNYKLGRLDKVLVLKFLLTQTDRPRYPVQDGSWLNHKNCQYIAKITFSTFKEVLRHSSAEDDMNEFLAFTFDNGYFRLSDI